MEGVGNRDGAAEPHPLIRAFSLRREWQQAREPLHVLRDSPDSCHYGPAQFTPGESAHFRKTLLKGVGVGLFFARDMLKRTGVPQGLVCVAHGGTSMQQWSPSLKNQGGAALYGSMFLSLRATAQPVAGVLWYQGEKRRESRRSTALHQADERPGRRGPKGPAPAEASLDHRPDRARQWPASGGGRRGVELDPGTGATPAR